jgi:hypothetical protein
VPAPLPTNTPTATPTNTSTSTPTATSTTTPVVCTTHVVLSEASNASTTMAADYTYVDQFALAVDSNFNAVTVTIAGASVTGAGDNLQIAIYSDSSNYPGQVLFTSLLHQITSTGSATYIFNPVTFSLSAGKYWLALHSSVAYKPNQNNPSATLNYFVNGHFPSPFPLGASSPGVSWSYSLDTCHP